MNMFLIVFSLIYGGMHLFTFIKIKNAFPMGTIQVIFLGLFFFLMVYSPLIVRRFDPLPISNYMAYAGYLWMGFIFLFISLSLIISLYNLLVFIMVSFSKIDQSFILNPQIAVLIPLIMTLFIMVYGYFEANNIVIETVRLETNKLPDNIASLKIIQISDLHLGKIIGISKLKKIIKLIETVKPDIIVSTGDLVENILTGKEHLAKLLKSTNPKYGMFAVTGNHEYYSGIEQAINFTRLAGFKLLRGDVVDVAGIINIGGVDDIAGLYYKSYTGRIKENLLFNLNKEKFTLLLKHQPDLDDEFHFDLQLSGHTHNGQIFPFSLITMMKFKFNKGLYKLAGGAYIYVSKGTGTWGPPIRFLSSPEVTLIELIRI